jgi:hypothetical protein
MNPYPERAPLSVDVRLFKRDVSEFTAQPDDVVRVTVAVQNIGDAQHAEPVRALLATHVIAEVVPVGSFSRLAATINDRARRALDDADRPEGYRDANSSRAACLPHFSRPLG